MVRTILLNYVRISEEKFDVRQIDSSSLLPSPSLRENIILPYKNWEKHHTDNNVAEINEQRPATMYIPMACSKHINAEQ